MDFGADMDDLSLQYIHEQLRLELLGADPCGLLPLPVADHFAAAQPDFMPAEFLPQPLPGFVDLTASDYADSAAFRAAEPVMIRFGGEPSPVSDPARRPSLTISLPPAPPSQTARAAPASHNKRKRQEPCGGDATKHCKADASASPATSSSLTSTPTSTVTSCTTTPSSSDTGGDYEMFPTSWTWDQLLAEGMFGGLSPRQQLGGFPEVTVN